MSNRSITIHSIDAVMEPSTLQPCHILKIEYPASKAKNAAKEYESEHGKFHAWHFIPPKDHEQRYEPTHLMHDQRTWRRSSRDNLEETSFFTVFSCPTGCGWHVPKRDMLTDLASFVGDVKMTCQYVGSTNVLVDTFTATNDDGRKAELLRIERMTTFTRGGGNIVTEKQVLITPLSAAINGAAASGERWLNDLADLINRTTELAVQHVRVRLHDKGLSEDIRYEWKPSRDVEKYEETVKEVFDMPKLAPLTGDVCRKCHSFFDTENHLAINIPCGHTTCHKCLALHLSGAPPDQAYCYVCQSIITIPQPHLDWIKYSRKNGMQPDDIRYSIFEECEESCADLDVDPDSESSADRVLDPDECNFILPHAWSKSVWNATADIPDRLIPDHLQLRTSPEFAIAVEKIGRLLDNLPDKNDFKIPELHQGIIDEVLNVLAKEVVGGRMKEFLKPEDLETIKKSPRQRLNIILRRPGLSRAIERLLLRTLRFVTYRRCDKPECLEATTSLWHHHGHWAEYWSPQRVRERVAVADERAEKRGEIEEKALEERLKKESED